MTDPKNSPVNEDSIENLSDPDADTSVQETGEDNDFESGRPRLGTSSENRPRVCSGGRFLYESPAPNPDLGVCRLKIGGIVDSCTTLPERRTVLKRLPHHVAHSSAH